MNFYVYFCVPTTVFSLEPMNNFINPRIYISTQFELLITQFRPAIK